MSELQNLKLHLVHAGVLQIRIYLIKILTRKEYSILPYAKLSIHLPSYLQYMYFLCQAFNPSGKLSIYLPSCLSLCQAFYLSVDLSIHLSRYKISIDQSVYTSAKLSIPLPCFLSLCQAIYPSAKLL